MFNSVQFSLANVTCLEGLFFWTHTWFNRLLRHSASPESTRRSGAGAHREEEMHTRCT